MLERRPTLDAEDADRSYVYMIDWRGRSMTDAAGVSEAVAAAGVSTTTIDFMQAGRREGAGVLPDGKTKSSVIQIKDEMRSNVWLPRTAFLRALSSGLRTAEAAGRVSLLHNTEAADIRLGAAPAPGPASPSSPAASRPAITVTATDITTGASRTFAPRLLVGADGMNSAVRAALERHEEEERGAGAAAAAGAGGEGRFRPVVLDSPAAGLRFRVLQLPPNAPFRRPPPGGGSGGEEAGRLENGRFGKVVGVRAPRLRALALGLLPLRDPAAPRSANIIVPPEHEVWAQTSGEALRDFLQASFPQLDIGALMTPQQLAAAATSRGGVFPRPQYLRHFTAVVPQPQPHAAEPAASPAAASGVVLLGDAVHCFPPDLGQGVNSSLADAVALVKALDAAGGDLAAGLPAFEAAAAPEAAALAELMTFSYPYQYNQDPVARAFWTANFLMRMLLNKVAPWAFEPHSFLLVQQPIPYVEALRRAHATTQRMWALAAALAAVAAAFLVRAAMGVPPS
ncbi:hypothetical protein HYH03_014117 [Edaphochlamys debaryana]|uniref:FAD-binding domain-containing protein n=1 Tax=Edaphochlamys debaryana TaxID=47281 RepID=A0A835XNR8_9CHLO|nr:hypothetical protein HYH03_014117 [Edaphochlamys debaryana]|eukprot:KAG2487276.1 hypothetical protein HYH03_014117 [Edaphochlamys debaryana]